MDAGPDHHQVNSCPKRIAGPTRVSIVNEVRIEKRNTFVATVESSVTMDNAVNVVRVMTINSFLLLTNVPWSHGYSARHTAAERPNRV